jgi:hypothetical protein
MVTKQGFEDIRDIGVALLLIASAVWDFFVICYFGIGITPPLMILHAIPVLVFSSITSFLIGTFGGILKNENGC